MKDVFVVLCCDGITDGINGITDDVCVESVFVSGWKALQHVEELTKISHGERYWVEKVPVKDRQDD